MLFIANMDEHEDEQPIKSPIKRYGSTRKIYLFNSEYLLHRFPLDSRHDDAFLEATKLVVCRAHID